MRKKFEMTDEQLKTLLDSCKPTPVMKVGFVCTGRSAQENANAAWARLGEQMGFDPMTVRPISGSSMQVFEAEAIEPIKPFEPVVSLMMDKSNELHELQSISREIRDVVSKVGDISDWLGVHEKEMQSGAGECITRLDHSIAELEAIKGVIDKKASDLENEVYAERESQCSK
jgi:hypothetical protein